MRLWKDAPGTTYRDSTKSYLDFSLFSRSFYVVAIYISKLQNRVRWTTAERSDQGNEPRSENSTDPASRSAPVARKPASKCRLTFPAN